MAEKRLIICAHAQALHGTSVHPFFVSHVTSRSSIEQPERAKAGISFGVPGPHPGIATANTLVAVSSCAATPATSSPSPVPQDNHERPGDSDIAVEAQVTFNTAIVAALTPAHATAGIVTSTSNAVTAGRNLPVTPGSLADPLPLPSENMQGLTRSQQIFALATGEDSQSLFIARGEEFFLFMRLREQHQWWTCGMAPKKYVSSTHMYNVELQKLVRVTRCSFVPKNPRALYAKLGEIETTILKKIQSRDFKCTHLNFPFITGGLIARYNSTSRDGGLLAPSLLRHIARKGH